MTDHSEVKSAPSSLKSEVCQLIVSSAPTPIIGIVTLSLTIGGSSLLLYWLGNPDGAMDVRMAAVVAVGGIAAIWIGGSLILGIGSWLYKRVTHHD